MPFLSFAIRDQEKECARAPASFWRLNVIAVVILVRVLARIWKNVIKCYKFHHFVIGRGLKLRQYKMTVLTFLLKKKMNNEDFWG